MRSMTSRGTIPPAAFCRTSINGDSGLTSTRWVTLAGTSVRSIVRSSPNPSVAVAAAFITNPLALAAISYVPGGTAGNR